jgi:hypothetical protein
MKHAMVFLLLHWTCLAIGAPADETLSPPVDRSTGVEVAEVQISGRIEGRQFALDLAFEAVTKQPQRRVLLVRGDVVLEKLGREKVDYDLDYDQACKAYYVTWPRAGRHHVSAAFVTRSQADPNGAWRQTSLEVASGRVRQIQLTCDRPDLEVQLPGAMRVQRRIEQGQLRLEAVLGPRQPFVVRWKPQVQLADAKLVLSSQANTIVDVRAGLLRVDTVFDFQVAQGKLQDLTLRVPAHLSITALDGKHIRNWTLADAGQSMRSLVVELSRAQQNGYRLRLCAEADVDTLPAEIEVPTVEPTGGIRASGHLAVGTDSALQLIVLASSGLTQIDATAFPRVQAEGLRDRPIPQGKVFFYVYAGSQYRLRLSADDIVPNYDVAGRYVATIKEDDLVVDAELELDVRDAPLRQLDAAVPAGLVLASVDGNQVDDYHLADAGTTDQSATVRVVFSQPVIGRTLIHLRLELGREPLSQRQTIAAIQVTGAKTHRGYVVVAAEAGIEIDDPEVENLREVHTASVPLRVAQAQFAYRFRQADWTLNLLARRKAAGIRAEVLHLQSIGEALAYGAAVANYVITGSPVDELRFRLPEGLENVEFVGSDVRRWARQDDAWVVKLTRRVIGDYSLAVTYSQRYGPDKPIRLGGLQCQDVQTQTGYVVVTSFLDLKLRTEPNEISSGEGLLPIPMDELPGDYRLLTNSPILAAYKYVADPHTAMLIVDPYERSGLLPVMLDIAAHHTRLAVRSGGRIESVTTVRYKVKNTTGQFLSLAMPKGTRVWAVSLIEPQTRGQKQTRLAASHDAHTGRLLIPLVRKANPNDPTTVEIEYGQVHEARGWWRRRLELRAPGCVAPIAYADWQVIVPDEWAIAAAGGNMEAKPQRAAPISLARLLSRIGQQWVGSIELWLGPPIGWMVGAAVLALTLICLILRRQWLPELVVAVLLGAALWLGIGAAVGQQHTDKPAPVTSLGYGQAVNADPNQAVQISAELVPAWRQNVTMTDVIVVPSVVVAVLVLAAFHRRLRWIATAMTIAASLYLAAKMPITWPALEAAMTWGLPAAAMAWLAMRALIRRRLGVSVPATAALLALSAAFAFVSGGCANQRLSRGQVGEHKIVESIRCRLVAGADNVELQYELRISANSPSSLPLLPESAVLVSPLEPTSHVALGAEGGWHTVQVDKAGVHELKATFLAPLPPAGEGERRCFEMPLPLALANSVTLEVPDANVLIEAPQAVHLAHPQQTDRTVLEAIFPPGQAALFTWQPRERQAAQEEVRFYAQDVGLAYLTSGLLQVFHAVRLQIAQGQVDTLKLRIPASETVTSVAGPHMGSWRFEPTSHQLEVRLMRPVTDVYELTLTTQSAIAAMPCDVRVGPLVVHETLSQHSLMGLAADGSVYFQAAQRPASMNVRDYVRESLHLVKAVPGLAVEQITQAFRFDSAESLVTGRVMAVQSELRSREAARFNVEDDRLIYNSQWIVEIAKAGRFNVALHLPEGFDIDALESEQVSHWNESVEGGRRRALVHFKRKLTGSIQLNLALSQPVGQMPQQLAVPHVMLADVLKHTGHLVIGSEQGVRLSVASRGGISELNPAELGHAEQGLLAFRLLRPDWQLDLRTEVVEPRVTVQSLHVAKVTEGLVRHHHYLRYRLYHAGSKSFDLTLPAEAAGVTISGAGIARREEQAPGVWGVELADKVYDRPYLLRVGYETRYDQDDGTVTLLPVRCGNVDLQQGHVVVYATDRVELFATQTDAALRRAEARSIPKYFGAGDLFGAAMCYRSASPEHPLTIQARRHAAAKQIGADVRRTDIATVVTATGQAITRVILTLRAGTARHLQAVLPRDATIWTLSVDGQATQPSTRASTNGSAALLIPLPQQASDDVVVDMVYVAALPRTRGRGRPGDWAGSHHLAGPRFALPLKEVTWDVYVPEGYMYDDFGGTLTIDREAAVDREVRRYDLRYYERQILETSLANDQLAQRQQTLARQLAQEGRQAAARRALAKGYNFSRGNRALNEDIRVDLDNLLRQQVKVGLVSARGRLRQQTSGAAGDETSNVTATDEENVSFSQEQAERIESSLGRADSQNLELITQKVILAQEAAEDSAAQLQVTLPISGKMLRFDSPLQVEPGAAMTVTFRAKQRGLRDLDPSVWCGLGLFAAIAAAGGLVVHVRDRWDRLHKILAPTPPAARPAEPAGPNGQVSAEELI